MKEYTVFVTWTVGASVVLEADSVDDAVDLAHGIDLDLFENQNYINNSFEVDQNIVEKVTSSSG
jgi:phosphosulfolactate synthase (CoM biosynthesis protein A)